MVWRSMEEALYTSRVKSVFLANKSLKLRTPLNAIFGFSQALEAGIKCPLSSDQGEYVDAINQSGEHLLSHISDILDLSKLEAGKARVYKENLVVSEIVDQARLLVGDRAREGQIDIHSLVKDTNNNLLGDKRTVLQILLNLESNAVKFTLPGGKVSVSASVTDKDQIILSVSDTGIGMNEDDTPRALSTFGQLDGDLGRRH